MGSVGIEYGIFCKFKGGRLHFVVLVLQVLLTRLAKFNHMPNVLELSEN